MIMLLCHRLSRALPLWVAALLGFIGAPLTVGANALADGKAAVANAEKALQRGDCGVASGLYQQATQAVGDAELAARASAVALACGQYPTARAIAERWVQIAPSDIDAMLALTHADLGSYRIPEARGHFKTLLHQSKDKVTQSIDEVTQRAGAEPVLAMVRDLDDARLSGGATQLSLAGLALEGWDAKQSLHYTQAARAAGASSAAAAAIAARAQAVLGDAKSAAAEAKVAATEPAGRLAPAQTMLLLGQDSDAVKELQRLRSDPDVGPVAARMLAQVAIDNADYAVAEQRCTALLEDAESAPLAVFYLGIIAERRGDDEAATRNYALLAGTGLEAQGRQRSAAILYRQGERDAAVRIVNAARDAAPDERIRGELAAADLLSTAGANDEALSRIESALRRSPGNPEISYQRAVLLERAGKVDGAIAALEGMHRERPLDAGITNALGYTLADHKRELPRAEQLIREALIAQPDNPALLDSLGWVLYRRGQYPAALPVLARAFRLLHDGDVGAHWGEVLWAAGQKTEARAAWQRALDSDPDNKLLTTTVHRYAPTLAAPKPPPALEPAPRTSI